MSSSQRVYHRSREIFAESHPASKNILGLLGLLLFQPNQFFRLLEKIPSKQSIIAAFLILALIAFSAIQQSSINTAGMIDASIMNEESLPSGETSNPAPIQINSSETWMTGLTAAGKQILIWLVLTIVLSEVSLFKGKSPKLGMNLRIVIWSNLPLALMAGLQVLFVLGGGKINDAGFTGFLDEWPAYASFNSYLQSAVYALAAQFNFFGLWSLALLYKGSRESLKGKRLAVSLVMAMWMLMLVFAFGFEHYQALNANEPEANNYLDIDLNEEMLPGEEMPVELETETESEEYQS